MIARKKVIFFVILLFLSPPHLDQPKASCLMKPSTYGSLGLNFTVVRNVLSDLRLVTLRRPRILKGGFMYVIVEASLVKRLKKNLLTYAGDVEREGLGVYIFSYEGGDPGSLRLFLKAGYPYGLKGALLIGDIPCALYEVSNPPGSGFPKHEVFPTDLFYMDLDGMWIDSDGNGIYDVHEGNREPEIWVGRLVPPVGGLEGVRMLVNYFRRDHEYRLGALRPPHRALIYVDDDWVSPPSAIDVGSKIKEALSPLYSSVRLVENKSLTAPSDYLKRLAAPWSLVHVFVHGWSGGHIFKVNERWDGYLNYTSLAGLRSGGYFYVLDSCSSARFTEKNYVAGYYLFRGNGLVVIGSTKAGGMYYYEGFYTRLVTDNVGEALLYWFKDRIREEEGGSWYGATWFYGVELLGDPTLKLIYGYEFPRGEYVKSIRCGIGDGNLTLFIDHQGSLSKGYSFAVYVDSDLNCFTGYGGADYLLEVSDNACKAYRWSGSRWEAVCDGELWEGLNVLIAHFRLGVRGYLRLRARYTVLMGSCEGEGHLAPHPGYHLRFKGKGAINYVTLMINESSLLITAKLCAKPHNIMATFTVSLKGEGRERSLNFTVNSYGPEVSNPVLKGTRSVLQDGSLTVVLPLSVLEGLISPLVSIKVSVYLAGDIPEDRRGLNWLYFSDRPFKFTLRFLKGWNLFSFPLVPLNFAGFPRGAIRSLYRWDKARRKWVALPEDWTDFEPGEGYWLEATRPFEVTYLGYVPLRDFGSPLSPGEIRPIGVIGLGPLDPSILCRALNATRIYAWEGRWVEYVEGFGGGIKELCPGKAYILERL